MINLNEIVDKHITRWSHRGTYQRIRFEMKKELQQTVEDIIVSNESGTDNTSARVRNQLREEQRKRAKG
jgi:hypothetical protein